MIGGFVFVVAFLRVQSEQQPGQVLATIDQSDIRGSEPHNHDPSGAASDCYRESGRACRIGQARVLLRACSACCSLCARDGWHRSMVFAFSFLGKLLSLLLFFLCCGSLADDHLCSGSNSPDESQQFTSNCRNDLSLGLASGAQFHIALV